LVRDFDSAESRMPDLESTFEGKTARLKYLKGREQNLNDRIRELRRQFEEQKQAEEGYKSTNQVVNRMMEAKRSGEIPGIYGRLVSRKLIIHQRSSIQLIDCNCSGRFGCD
jgi:chromosome segregation ATPase